ncbi:MAG: zinc metallopeptidase [Firmicutes bacterium]|jgi:Zn-dependent membrane protease YugP|nr:zinc metallopeptidase [Bacillota bacterium]NLL89323.1 zinc metallopeptidase [Bacillota bacterium]
MFFYFDPTYILIVPALIFAMWAQVRVNTTFRKYLRVFASSNYTGAQVARYLLDAHGLQNVKVEMARGNLTDHYDPRTRVLRLSQPVYSSTSVAALGVAAHETGHAVQNAENYIPLGIRNNLFPIANFGSQAALPLFFIGLLFANPTLMDIGIWFFIAALVFQVVTLPVEFNASRRALGMLTEAGFLSQDERPKAKEVLSAAALTYVAAVAVSAMNLLRLFVLRDSRRR